MSYQPCWCYTCRKDGNPFNTTIIPSAPALAPSPFALAPVTVGQPTSQTGSGQPFSSGTPESDGASGFFSTRRIMWIAIIGTVIVVALGSCLLVPICLKRRSKHREDTNSADMASKYKPKPTKPPSVAIDDMEKGTSLIFPYLQTFHYVVKSFAILTFFLCNVI